jgi:NADH-quinone oxidoreductase subunit M
MLNHGVSTGGLFMVVGMLSDRRHTRLIAEYGGLKAVTPQLVRAFLIITLASIALPLTNGFIGEFLILIGAFQWSPKLASFAATGVILSAVYMLWMFQRVNYGPIVNEKNRALPDLSRREWSMVVPIVAMAIVMGVYPNPFLRPMEPAVNRVIERVTGRQPAQAQASPAPPATPGSEARASGGAPAAATPPTSGATRPDALQGSRP